MNPLFEQPAQATLPKADAFRIVAGSLSTTRAATAIGIDSARRVKNCDTGQGDWRLDLRHRRFAAPPDLLTEGEAGSGEGVFGGAGSQEPRAGATVSWANPANVSIGPPEASAVLDLGEKTHWLQAWGIVPSPLLPDDAVLTLARVVVRHHATLSGVPIYLVGVEFRVGDDVRAFYPLTELAPIIEEDFEIEIDLDAIGLSVAEINSGDVSIRIAYDAYPNGTDAFDPSNWDVVVAPTSPVTDDQLAVLDLEQVFTATATWTGDPGAAPPFVPLTMTSLVNGGGHGYTVPPSGPTYATSFVGSADVDDGLSHSAAGAISGPSSTIDSPGSRAAGGTTTVVTPVGVPYVVTMSADIEVTDDGTQSAYVSFGLSAGLGVPSPSTVYVEEIRLEIEYETPSEGGDPLIGVPWGVLYAAYEQFEEYSAIYAPGSFVAAAVGAETAYAPKFGANVSPAPLPQSPWRLWLFDGKVFYTNPEGGVWYRPLGGPTMIPLYRDVESPGSSGSGSFVADAGLLDFAVFDPTGGDTLSFGGSPVSGSKTGFQGDNRLGVETKQSYAEFQITLAETIDALGADAIGVVLTAKTGTSDGYSSNPANNFVVLTDHLGNDSVSIPLTPVGRLNVKGGTYSGWGDLTAIPDSIKGDVKEIKLRVGTKPGLGSTDFKVETFAFGGIRYKATEWQTATTANTAEVAYAYRFTEGAIIGPASPLVVTSKSHLGSRLAANQSYMGATTTITVPPADAPFTGAATIELYRVVDGTYRKLTTGPNTQDLVYTDRLRDDEITASPGTYPVTTLSFEDTGDGFSGQVVGIVCGCAWRGSNIYSGMDGKLYGSRTNAFADVLWDNVVKTNDQGSGDLSFPRTFTLSDDSKTPALCLVPGDSLYALTEFEVYAIVGGQTFGTASFPRKVDGGRGVVGVYAATVFADACLYGARDGLWFVRKTGDENSQPDELQEITKDNRGAWKWLLGDSPSTLVVRHHMGDVWCLNGTRYLHVTRQAKQITGVWADGRSVVDASSDLRRGLVLQLSDGSLAIVGEYLSDGGTNLEGTNGARPEWLYSTGVEFAARMAERVVIHARLSEGGEVSVTSETERGDGDKVKLDNVEGGYLKSQGFFRSDASGTLSSYTLRGKVGDRILTAYLETANRNPPVTQDDPVSLS